MAQPFFGRSRRYVVLLLAAAGLGAPASFAQSQSEIEDLKRQMRELMRVNAEQQKQIDKLQKQVEKLSAQPAPPAASPPSAAAAAAATPIAPVESEIDKALA